MSRLWKAFVAISLLLNGVCLLYVYLILHPNPFGPQYYAAEQTKQELRQLKDELDETNKELDNIRMAVKNLHADVVPRK